MARTLQELVDDIVSLILEGKNTPEEVEAALEEAHDTFTKKLRVAWGKGTEANRLKPDDPSYGVHMTHCYMFDHDMGHGEYGCKYGEDAICPAAIHEDPYAYWKSLPGNS